MNLADDNGIPKWKSHAYCGVYVSHSNHHASNVMLVWNPKTKLVSPQYHIVFDKEFTTVLVDRPLNAEDVDLALVNLLCLSEWWHHDQSANTTKEDNTSIITLIAIGQHKNINNILTSEYILTLATHPPPTIGSGTFTHCCC